MKDRGCVEEAVEEDENDALKWPSLNFPALQSTFFRATLSPNLSIPEDLFSIVQTCVSTTNFVSKMCNLFCTEMARTEKPESPVNHTLIFKLISSILNNVS